MPIAAAAPSPSRKRSSRFDNSDSDSESSSDDYDDEDDDERKRKKVKATMAAKPRSSASAAPPTPKTTTAAMPNAAPAPTPPNWTTRAQATMQAKYPDHRFGVVLKAKAPDAPANAPDEWRIRCHDCPGRLYNPGPEETFNNFEVHLKNRQHRERVEARIAGRK